MHGNLCEGGWDIIIMNFSILSDQTQNSNLIFCPKFKTGYKSQT